MVVFGTLNTAEVVLWPAAGMEMLVSLAKLVPFTMKFARKSPGLPEDAFIFASVEFSEPFWNAISSTSKLPRLKPVPAGRTSCTGSGRSVNVWIWLYLKGPTRLSCGA